MYAILVIKIAETSLSILLILQYFHTFEEDSRKFFCYPLCFCFLFITNYFEGKNIMFDKYKKYKIIAVVVFIIGLAVFLLGNLKIQSVKSYQEEHKNNGYVALENETDALSTAKQESNKNETNSNETISPKEIQDKEIDGQTANNNTTLDNLEQSLSENETNAVSLDNLENSTNSIDKTDSNQVVNPDNINLDDLDKTQSENTTSESTSEPQYITCSIEIRCDVAVEFKDSIKNEGIKNSIPSDGTILRKISYKIPVGQKVYDFLMQACVDNHILVAANNGYVTSINNLSEKAISYGSGWMYKVNGISPNVGALSYTLKEGDTVLWYYVNNGKDG